MTPPTKSNVIDWDTVSKRHGLRTPDPMPPMREDDVDDWSGFWALWTAIAAVVALLNWGIFWR